MKIYKYLATLFILEILLYGIFAFVALDWSFFMTSGASIRVLFVVLSLISYAVISAIIVENNWFK